MTPSKWVLASIGCVALVAAIAIAGWKGGWWLARSGASNSAHVQQNSYGAQSAAEQQAQNLIAQVRSIDVQVHDPTTPPSEVPSLQAQESSIVTQACQIITTITQPTTDLNSFSSANC